MLLQGKVAKTGEPEEVANAIVFLASDKAKYITDLVLNVSGGIELFTFCQEDYFLKQSRHISFLPSSGGT
jgi:hypothetical protein